jgi:phage-related protein (TIGR01555 family)
MVKKKAKVVDRNDGWGNVFSQLGVRGKDKMTGATIAWCPLGYATEEALYAQDDMASKIADALPEDSMRQEFILKGYEDDVVKKFWKRWYQLKLTERVVDGWTQGRIYGGAAVVIVNNDKLDVPFDPKLKRPVLAMQVINRHELPYHDINKNFASENFGMPEYYTVSPRNFTNTSFNKVHHSRVVRFDGAKLPTNLFVNNSYWHDSIFTKLWSPLKSYNLSFAGAATAMQDWRVGVMKIKNLAALFANNQEEKVAKRIGAIDLGKSIARSIIIDSDESYEYANTSFSGADSMLDRMSGRYV